MSERNNTDLVVNALVMALARRDPDGELVITRTGVRPTHRWSSPTGSPTGISTRLTARPVTAMTTPRWNRSGRPSNARSSTSTAAGNLSPDPNYARSCSTTSKSSTTEPATKPDSSTTHPPRPTLHQQHELTTTRVSPTGELQANLQRRIKPQSL